MKWWISSELKSDSLTHTTPQYSAIPKRNKRSKCSTIAGSKRWSTLCRTFWTDQTIISLSSMEVKIQITMAKSSSNSKIRAWRSCFIKILIFRGHVKSIFSFLTCETSKSSLKIQLLMRKITLQSWYVSMLNKAYFSRSFWSRETLHTLFLQTK